MFTDDDAPLIGIEDGVIVRFFTKAFKNKAKSTEEKPHFENREMVEITFSGDNKSVINEIVKDYHRKRFPQSYKAFKEGSRVMANGYPIDKWELLDPATKATLKYLNVMTIEQLAEMSDANLPNLGMGAHEMREKARKWVSANRSDAKESKLQAQIDALQAQIAAMGKAQVATQVEEQPLVQGETENESEEVTQSIRPRGRPRKETVAYTAPSADELPPHMQVQE